MTDGREQKGNKTKEALLHATIALIAENGLEALSANSIAKKANISKASVFHHFGSMETIQQEAFILTDSLMGEALEEIYQNARGTDSFADIMLKYFLFFIDEKNNDYLNLINVQMQFVMKSSYDTEFEELVFGKDSEKTPFDFFEILVNDFYGDKLDANDLELVNDLIIVHINGFAAFLISKADQEWLVSIWKENIKMIENYIESLIESKS
ncbi:TetR/AcrR family transcriptional regulator [Paenibacillus lutimineralis]|uniref:TetR/AcrR family transcriptional regulator n=1 Tax=Paenibacillus lutimineralis TaxID=2707005 RepID=A0A3Q9I9C5_9BACL|nr:TetR/AcrR family transcriptional regulator [Paenibacillus lutimineralis]AZS15549.1 TetR/AcrR family transcriptional regulator [Paenibacillus lutimineralis]